MSLGLKEWAKDDPEFARQQMEKLIESGQITRSEGEELLRMRYGARNGDSDGDAMR
jgi:hypothetical protein